MGRIIPILITFVLYKLFGKLESLLKVLSMICSRAAWWVHGAHWRSKMPDNVYTDKFDLAVYACPFCHTDLDYRIDFDSVLCGVCWQCKKAWHKVWDSSDCPDYDNCNWPTKQNVLSEPPSAFWEDALWHWFQVKDGLHIDQGRVEPPLQFPL